MDQGYYFDNVLVANEASKAEEYRSKYWQPKHEVELVCCYIPQCRTCYCASVWAVPLRLSEAKVGLEPELFGDSPLLKKHSRVKKPQQQA